METGNKDSAICYTDDEFEICGPVIRGEYDDYGGIKEVKESEEGTAFLNAVKKFTADGNIKSTADETVSEENLQSIEKFVNEILGRGAVFNNKRFTFLMMHESIFKETAGKLDMGEFKTQIKGVADKYQNYYDKFSKFGNENIEELMDGFFHIPLGARGTSGYHPIINHMCKNLVGKWGLFEDVQRFVRFSARTRKSLFPPSGAGSQSEVNDFYELLAEATKKKFLVMDKKWNPEKYRKSKILIK